MSDLLDSFAHRLLPAIRDHRIPAPFSVLALELFRAQWNRNAAYRRFVEASGLTVDAIRHCDEIPAVPTVAFKELELTALAPAERTRVFHSSGTTGQRPSRHFHGRASLRLYEASLEGGFARGFWRGTRDDDSNGSPAAGWVPVSLTPPAGEVPHSSLVHMVDRLGSVQDVRGTQYIGRVAAGGAWDLDVERAMATLSTCVRSGRPVVLFGTAYNFVHLIEGLDRDGVVLHLPEGSRVMETGGYKGRSREWAKSDLRTAITRCLGVSPEHIVGEYGMSELCSQAYEEPMAAGSVDRPGPVEASRGFIFPPWVRPLVISPRTGRVAKEGEAGLLRIVDLANVWSVMAVQTEDRALERGGVVELLGRAAAAEPRGCSLMAV